MNRDLCRDFIELAYKKIANSTWTYDQACTEMIRIFEIEQDVWKQQDYETNSVFFGKSYL